MSVTLFGLLYWGAIFAATIFLSNNIYYRFNNYFLVIAPFSIFALLYAVLKVVNARSKNRIVAGPYFIVAQKKDTLLNLLSYGALLGALFIVHNVVSHVGISIFDAYELRQQFWGNIEILSSLAGGFIVPILWITNGLLLALLANSILFDMSNGVSTSVRSITIMISGMLVSASSGGRLHVLLMIILYLSFLYSGMRILRVKSIANKIRHGILLIVVLGMLFLFLQSLNRSAGESFDVGDNSIIVNFVGPVFALDQLINGNIIYDIQVNAGRIGLSLLGLDSIFASGFMRFLFKSEVSSLQSLVGDIMHYGVDVSESVRTNAFYTAGFGSYVDFGIIGYCLFFLLLGLCAFYSDLKAWAIPKVEDIYFPAIMYYFVFLSARLSPFDDPTAIFFLIFFFVFYRYFNFSVQQVRITSLVPQSVR